MHTHMLSFRPSLPLTLPPSPSSHPLLISLLPSLPFIDSFAYSPPNMHTHLHTLSQTSLTPSHTLPPFTPTHTDDSGVQGLIKFSATVLGPGDTQKIHDPVNEEKEAEEDLELSEGAGVVDAGDGSQQTLQFLVLGTTFIHMCVWVRVCVT